MPQKRDVTIDVLKFFAIIMVVLGHCIQYGSGIEYRSSHVYLMNHIYQYIYSFHMPLFALVSGYLFYYSVSKRDIKQITINRISNLMIPILGWKLIINIFRNGRGIIASHDLGKSINILTGYFTIYKNMWFLWAMLVCSGIVIVGHYIFNDNIMLYIIVVFGTFFVYDYYYQLWVWLLPFFIIGYFANKNNWRDMLSKNHAKWIILIGLIIHVACVILWKNDYYIYKEGRLCILDDDNMFYALYANFFRIISGLSGSFVWFIFADFVSEFVSEDSKAYRIIYLCSKYSIGIYVFSVYILNDFLVYMTWMHYNIFYVIIETIIILILSLLFMSVVDKFKYSRKLLLGVR